MDTNNWRPAQSEPPAAAMDGGGDWRSQLQADSRQRIVNKIMETLKRHLPFSGQEGLQELKKIAVRFEEKIYTAATSQSDYLRKISLKMLTMESKSQVSLPNTMSSNSAGVSKNPQDPASQNMQQQLQNQGPSLPLPMAANQSQARQQLLAQNIQNNIMPVGMQSSSSLPSSLPSVSGLTQNSMPSVPQSSNLQSISGISQNPLANSVGHGMTTNMFTNAQRQMQGRQPAQSVGTQQQSQQSQNPQQFMYQQLQQQLMTQKLQPGNMQQSLLQPQLQQQQQQNVLQTTPLQSSQPSVMQPSMISGMQQNQQPSIQQPSQSVLQQHRQSVMRQQHQSQQTQTPVVHQQQAQMAQMSPQQQQQQLMVQQSNAANVQQTLLGQQSSSIQDLQQQQRLVGQQNSLPSLPPQQHNNHQSMQQPYFMGQQSLANLHQQQLGSQNHVDGLQQQQQVLGSQSGNSSMQTNQQSVHMLQQSKIPVQQQTQNASPMLPNGGQQSHPQQQHLMSQLQSQPSQLQQQLGLQQQPNSLHNNMQRLQTSSPLLQQQNMVDQQKQFFQSQRAPSEAPSTSLDSTAQTGNGNVGDWQEEIFQKIKAMKDVYFADLNEMFQKISFKLQQHDSIQPPAAEQLNRLRGFKQMLERFIQFLQLPKNNITHAHKEKLPSFEKHIINILNSHRPRKPISNLQQGQVLPQMQSMQQSQQPHPQIPQAQSHDNGMNPQLQSMHVQGAVTAAQPSNVPSLQQNSMPSLSGATTSQPNMNSVQPSSSLDSGQGNLQNSMHQLPSSLQQNQQVGMNSLPPQSGVNLLQPNMNPLQSNPGVLQNQHLKPQDHQMMQTQHLKPQIQQRQLQHQLLQKQHMLQQQQQQHQQQMQSKSQQPAQMQAHQMPQLHQMNDMNDLKMRQGMGLKSGALSHLQSGQRYPHQQLKPAASFHISSPQLLQAVSPQMNQHSSPQIDQQSLMQSVSRGATPLQSSNSPYVPSPSTPLAPSPMPGDTEKPNSAVSSLSNAANIGHQQPCATPAVTSSLAIGTPGISASPILAECTVPDANHVSVPNIASGKSGLAEQPLERLMRAVKSMSSKALSASVSDIGSVVSMIDRIAGSAPGNGSRAAVGEDLVAMTKCRLQARNFITQDGNSGIKRMRRYTSVMPLNVASSVGSMNDSFKQLTGPETSELESTATSSIKRPRTEVNHVLLEEIKEINECLIDTIVDISDEDVDRSLTAAAAGGGEGCVVKCCFSAVALSPDLKSQYASAQMSPIQPLKLLVPADYPNCSPVLLDKLPVEVSKEYEDLSVMAKSRFNISLRSLSQPMSLREIARAWDNCARAVISEYAQQNGGGTFSSKYGSWENCLSTA